MKKNIEKLFNKLEEIILANSGIDEFEEVLKLLTLQLWIREKNEGLEKNKKDLEVLLRDVVNDWPGVITAHEFKLSEEDFNDCWSILSRHNFDIEMYSEIDYIFEMLVSKQKKGSKGQYFTPRHIIDFCVKMINPKEDEKILDPSSGSGAFLYHAKRHTERNSNNLYGVDIDKDVVRISILLSHLSKTNINIYNGNSLLKPRTDQKSIQGITIEDIMRVNKIKKGFDIVLSNPPFAGEVRSKDILGSYIVGKNKNKVERDVLFLERSIDLLNERGRMAIILPDNVFSGKDNVTIREYIQKKCKIVSIISLPRNAFYPYTSVKTNILFLEKENTNNKDYEIFYAICETKKGNEESELNLELKNIEKKFRVFSKINNIRW
ncbi:MAG: HsdM family class I SAM-dependent methyltransferase [Lactococcus cremoris]